MFFRKIALFVFFLCLASLFVGVPFAEAHQGTDAEKEALQTARDDYESALKSKAEWKKKYTDTKGLLDDILSAWDDNADAIKDGKWESTNLLIATIISEVLRNTNNDDGKSTTQQLLEALPTILGIVNTIKSKGDLEKAEADRERYLSTLSTLVSAFNEIISENKKAFDFYESEYDVYVKEMQDHGSGLTRIANHSESGDYSSEVALDLEVIKTTVKSKDAFNNDPNNQQNNMLKFWYHITDLTDDSSATSKSFERFEDFDTFWKLAPLPKKYPCGGDCGQKYETPVRNLVTCPYPLTSSTLDIGTDAPLRNLPVDADLKGQAAPAGSGKMFYLCSVGDRNEHRVRICGRVKDVNGDGIKTKCGDPFRKCTNSGCDHGGLLDRKKHSDAGGLKVGPANPLLNAVPGEEWTSELASASVFSRVDWYVAGVADSGRGTLVTSDAGDGVRTESEFVHTFSSVGAYVITGVFVDVNAVEFESSYAVSVITMVPGAPSIYGAFLGESYLTLLWRKPASDGGVPISDYAYRYRDASALDFGEWVSVGKVTNKKVRELTSGTDYTFEVRAKNSEGWGVSSEAVTYGTLGDAPSDPVTPPEPDPPPVVVPPTPISAPGKPTGLSVVSASNGVVKLSWVAPENDGGVIDTYEFRVDKNNDGSFGDWESFNSSDTAGTLNLENGRRYGIEVRAKNSLGESVGSSMVSAMPVDSSVSVPSAPRNLKATADDGAVDLSWTAPASGSGIIDYAYSYDAGHDGSWRSWRVTDSTRPSYTVTGLTNEKIYGFRVRALNAGGFGSASGSVTATPTDMTVPSKPRNLRVSMTADKQLHLEWDSPSDTGGSAITNYQYSYDKNNDGSWNDWGSPLDSGTDEYLSLTGFTLGATYAFRVRAVNKIGSGAASSKAVLRIPNVPGQSLNLTVSLTTEGNVYLDWDSPSDNGGRSITDYEYGMDTDADELGELWERLGQTETAESLWGAYFTLDVTYKFRVRAVNLMGVGAASEQVNITITAATTPSAPQYLTADAGNASVYLSWSDPAEDGYGEIRGGTLNYQYRYRQSDGEWSSWSADQWETYVTVGSLTNGTTYAFEVQAKNDAGTGLSAAASATPTNTAVPGVPLYFDTISENGAVDLWWDPPEYDGGSPITDYEYRYRESGGTWNGWVSAGNASETLPKYLVTGLTNGTTYEFEVRAINAVGPGPSTETLSETPKAKKPDSPTGLSATAGTAAGSIDLTWTAPNDNGSPITGYQYRYCKYDNGWKNWTKYAATGSTATSYTVTGLESGEVYRFRVRAVNSVGDGGSSKVAQTNAP